MLLRSGDARGAQIQIVGRTAGEHCNFYIEQAEIVRAVGAVSERLHTPNSAREDTLRAVTRALCDRQTVVLSMPLDVQHAPFASNLLACPQVGPFDQRFISTLATA